MCEDCVHESDLYKALVSLTKDKTQWKESVQQTVLPLLDQLKLEYALQEDGTFAYLRISTEEAKGNLNQLKRELSGRNLDIGGGGEGVIGWVYGPQVTAPQNWPKRRRALKRW